MDTLTSLPILSSIHQIIPLQYLIFASFVTSTITIYLLIKWVPFVIHMYYIPTAPGASFPLGHIPLMYKIKSKEKCNESQAMHIMIEGFLKNKNISKAGVFKVFFGPIPLVVVTSAESASPLLKSKTLPKSFIYKYLDMMAIGLANLNGEKWRYHRKLLTPAFDYKMIQELPSILSSNSLSLHKSLQHTVEQKTGQVNDLGALMSLYSLRVLLESGIGLNEQTISSVLQKNSETVIQELERTFDESADILVQRMLEPWNYFDSVFKITSSGKRMQQLLNFMTGLVQQVLDKRKEDIANGKIDPTAKTTFIDILLKEHESHPERFTKEDVDGELRTFLAAGHESTATSLTWFLFHVGHYPEVQKRIQDEVDSIFESKEDPDEGITLNDLRSMKYLESAINESLRLAATTPLFSRTADVDIEIQDGRYTIPQNSVIVIYPYFIQRDENVWPNAATFDPDRFYDQTKLPVPHSFIPFSAGHRSCIGQRYAMLTMLGLTASIFRKFNITSLDPIDTVKGSLNISFRPDRILKLRVEERN